MARDYSWRVGGEREVGNLLERFTWFKQSGYLWKGQGLAVYIDPWEVPADGPPADLLFITHAHFDHFSHDDIEKVRRDSTRIFAPTDVAAELSGNVTAVAPGDSIEALGVRAQAVPAYNVAESRLDFHPQANRWVGYIFSMGGADYYHAGDTDHLHELESVRADVAFVPIGGTYTMDAEEAAGLVKAMNPGLAVPMHYGHVEGVGVKGDAQRFAAAAAPVRVEILTPTVPQAG
jgi:L-ascorbate metabolism protein UlaG (beta-lactamase superfamily)